MLSRTRELEHLATAQRHVIRCQQLIRLQIAVIRLQRANQWRNSDSLNLLRELRIALLLGRQHMHAIERALEGAALDRRKTVQLISKSDQPAGRLNILTGQNRE